MSITKATIEQISQIQNNDKALKLLNKLQQLADNINSLGVFNVKVEDLICNTNEEFAILKGFRNRTVTKQKEKMQRYHDKVFNSTFYEE